MDLIAQLARELNLKAANIEAAVKLIDEGNTIPFISRYRKEATGGMDRSEERRVGKECEDLCRSRWSPYH